MARASYSFLEEDECQQRHYQGHGDDQKSAQNAVAPRILRGEPLERVTQPVEPVLGERAVREARQLRQRRGPVRRLAAQVAEEPAPADLLVHPAFEIRLGGAPQVELRVELAAEALDVEQRLLQHDELRLDAHVEA